VRASRIINTRDFLS